MNIKDIIKYIDNCTEYRNCEECIIEFFKKKASEENEKNNSI